MNVLTAMTKKLSADIDRKIMSLFTPPPCEHTDPLVRKVVDFINTKQKGETDGIKKEH